ncbi:DUF58 domain-containing protein [Candidatus Woesearchaeota archaeon]|nr:DUF58 domain-containing protein [Candidatus Woesearchaeota archaeon]
MINLDFLSQLKRFGLIVNKRVTSSFAGTKKSTHLGRGLIVNDFRQYVPGDDYRAIDWRIYARTDNFYVKRYEEEKALTVHVIIDVSKSMTFGTKKYKKFEYAAMLGLGFAYLAARENNNFFMSTMSKDIVTFRAKRGMSQVVGFLHHLNKVKCEGIIEFEELMRHYKKNITSRSMIVVISDFLFNIEEIKNVFPLFKNHELKIIQILDRSETNFELRGSVILKDSETEKEIETYISEAKRQEYREKLYEHILMIEQEARAVGGKFFLLSTEQPLFDSFYKILNT